MIAAADYGFKLKVIKSPNMPNPSKIKDEPFSWSEIKYIIRTNKLENFARSEEQTKRYLNFKMVMKQNNITVFKHLLINELKWYVEKLNNDIRTDQIHLLDDNEIKLLPRSNRLFMCEEDLKILPNHFPYYFHKNVAHLCIWSKVKIESDPSSPNGDISDETRALIEKYIEKTFIKKLGIDKEKLVWFRNWEALQSVKSISHIHVLIKDINESQLDEILYRPGEVLVEDDINNL